MARGSTIIPSPSMPRSEVKRRSLSEIAKPLLQSRSNCRGSAGDPVGAMVAILSLSLIFRSLYLSCIRSIPLSTSRSLSASRSLLSNSFFSDIRKAPTTPSLFRPLPLILMPIKMINSYSRSLADSRTTRKKEKKGESASRSPPFPLHGLASILTGDSESPLDSNTDRFYCLYH